MVAFGWWTKTAEETGPASYTFPQVLSVLRALCPARLGPARCPGFGLRRALSSQAGPCLLKFSLTSKITGPGLARGPGISFAAADTTDTLATRDFTFVMMWEFRNAGLALSPRRIFPF